MLSAQEIVEILNKSIIGQQEAKEKLALALRNKYRRLKLPLDVQAKIKPTNILLAGPTGCGKTALAKTLAELLKTPFLKIDATSYTEIGYVGKNVNSIIEDLVACSLEFLKKEYLAKNEEHIKKRIDKTLIQILVKNRKSEQGEQTDTDFINQITANYFQGFYDNELVEIECEKTPKSQTFNLENGISSIIDLNQVFNNLSQPHKTVKKKVVIKLAQKILLNQELNKSLTNEINPEDAVALAEEEGIIFIDEIDKLSSNNLLRQADVSREGVQRDLLPLIDGTIVNTKYGPVRTNHILFIAAGAFSLTKISDLMPEFQGRFPLVAHLNPLTENDFKDILTLSNNSCLTQYCSLLAADGIKLTLTPDACQELAAYAFRLNGEQTNIGARRLPVLLEELTQEISLKANGTEQEIIIDAAFVKTKLSKLIKNEDLKHYIL